MPESRPKGGTALINMFEPALASLSLKSKRQVPISTDNYAGLGLPFACGGFGPICIADESFPTVLPPCDEKSKFIMNARRHFAGSFDSDSEDSDCGSMPELVNNSSSAISSDDNRVASLPIARKKKAVLEVSRGKCVLVSNTSDDNESMSKLFASNLSFGR